MRESGLTEAEAEAATGAGTGAGAAGAAAGPGGSEEPLEPAAPDGPFCVDWSVDYWPTAAYESWSATAVPRRSISTAVIAGFTIEVMLHR